MRRVSDILDLFEVTCTEDLLAMCADDLGIREAVFCLLRDVNEVSENNALYGQLYAIAVWAHQNRG